VEELLRDPERRRAMGRAARERARSHFAAAPLVARLEAHVETVAAQRAR
jgi:hypothetical protein